MPESQQKTMASASKISFAVLCSRVLGVVRESIFARLFGAGLFADAYVVAYRIPNLLRDLFAEGALSSAFVPLFTKRLKQEGNISAFEFGNLVLSGILCITGFIGLLGMIFTPTIVGEIAAGFPGEPAKYNAAIFMTRILIPTFTLISLSAVFMGMLNGQKHFFMPAIAPALFNVVSVLSGLYLCFSSHKVEQLAFLWCVFTVISTVVQLGCQIPLAWKTGWRPRFRLKGIFKNQDVRKMVFLMLPSVLGIAIVNINVFVNTRFASNIEGGLAHLNYAFRLFYLPIGLFGVAFGTVAATTVAEFVSEKKIEQLKGYLNHTLKLNWLLSIPCTFGLAVLSFPTVRVLFQRGEFTVHDTRQTGFVLCAYLIGLIPFTSVKILVPTFFALESPKLSLFASMAAVSTNCCFNYFTYKHLGAIGIACGVSLATCVQILFLSFFLSRKIGSLGIKDLFFFFLKVSVASCFMSLFTIGIYWGGAYGLKAFFNIRLGGLFTLMLLFFSVFVSVLVYFPFCKFLKIEESQEVYAIFNKIKRKFLPAK